MRNYSYGTIIYLSDKHNHPDLKWTILNLYFHYNKVFLYFCSKFCTEFLSTTQNILSKSKSDVVPKSKLQLFFLMDITDYNFWGHHNHQHL